MDAQQTHALLVFIPSLGGFALSGLWMSLLWTLHLPLKNASIVDVGWPISLVIYTFFAYYFTGQIHSQSLEGIHYSQVRLAVLGLVILWAARLSIYLFWDRIYKQPEEGRYQALRKKWKTNVAVKFYLFFQAQSFLNLFLSIPFVIFFIGNGDLNSLPLVLSFGLALLGIIGESIADLQLKFFKRKPTNKGKLCRVGLWNYSRHPNYFFECMVWLGFGILPLAYGFTTWYLYLGLIAPVLILATIFKLTGIPATEEQALKSRGEAYQQYQKEVNMFFPGPPKTMDFRQK